MSVPSVSILIPYELTELQQQALYVWLETVSSFVEIRRPFERRNQRHAERVRDQRELLLLRLQLWQEEHASSVMQTEFANLRHTIRKNLHTYYEIGVSDGMQFDTEPITSAVRRFSVDLQAFEPLVWEEDNARPLELEQLIQKIGTLPRHRIELTAFDEMIEDHTLAAFMAADLAEQYEGWVQLNLRPNFHTIRAEAEWTVEHSRALAQSLGGQFHEVTYTVGRTGQAQAYFLADAELTRNWSQHDRFWI